MRVYHGVVVDDEGAVHQSTYHRTEQGAYRALQKGHNGSGPFPGFAEFLLDPAKRERAVDFTFDAPVVATAAIAEIDVEED